MKEKYLIKPSYGVKVGYAFGALPDSMAYNLFYVYFLYLITDVVKLPAYYAGLISLIVILWDALTDPIVGYASDNCKSKYGRRRPFMIFALGPLCIFMILLFTSVDMNKNLAFFYYVIMGILYWTAYKIYVIPYYALGAELTNDFDERTNLRGAAGIGMYMAMWFVSAGPMAVLSEMEKAGYSEQQSWIVSAAILGVLSAIGGYICWRSCRGKEVADKEDFKREEGGKFFSNYTELFKLKAIRRFLLMTFIYNVAFAIALAAFVYIMENNLGLSAAEQSFYWTCYSALTLAFVPICNIISNIFGKKEAMILLTGIAIVGCIIFFINGINSFPQLIIFTVLYNLGNVCYWTVGYSLMYDCTELDEYVNKKRREGAITGFSSFMQKLGGAIGMYITGWLLGVFGYDGSARVQTEEALQGIITVNTLIPAILMAFGTVFIILYPITKERFNKLLDILKKREAGESYEEDDDIRKLI